MTETDLEDIQKMAGFVMVPRGDKVIIWLGFETFLRNAGYESPLAFRKGLDRNDAKALKTARDAIARAKEKLHEGLIELGVHGQGMTFHRLSIEEKAYVTGTITPKVIMTR